MTWLPDKGYAGIQGCRMVLLFAILYYILNFQISFKLIIVKAMRHVKTAAEPVMEMWINFVNNSLLVNKFY
ncbi:MAG: hypothetical protein ABIN94_02575 [Ferruginibacter sp.]